MEPLFELALRLPQRGSGEVLRELHSQLRSAIVDGRLKPGLRMPSTRALAASQRIARNTVIAAYELLLSDGYLVTRRGSGTYVAEGLPRQPQRRRDPARAQAAGKLDGPDSTLAFDDRLNPLWAPGALPTLPPESRGEAAPLLNFRLGAPDVSLFPFDLWRRLLLRAVRHLPRAGEDYDDPHGYRALREAIARHTSVTRAVACGPEDILVTAGAQQAFDLLARTLVTPNKTVVAVENPGYPPLWRAFAAAGAKLIPIPVDTHGMMVAALPPQSKVICVTPSHQFPLGCAMSMSRRTALLEFAQARGAVIIEDDYDCEFRFGDRPLDALQTLDRSESVFYVGTFAKSLFPALRLGFIVAPMWARRALVEAKAITDGRCPGVTQAALAEFIAAGHLTRHVRRMRQIYGERRRLLLEGLRRDFARWLDPIESLAGLHLAAFLRQPADTCALVSQARRSGVGIQPLQRYDFEQPTRPGVVFGYGCIGESAISEALRLLRSVYARSTRAAKQPGLAL